MKVVLLDRKGDVEYAEKLREIADQVASGEISDFVVAGYHRVDGHFFGDCQRGARGAHHD